MKKYMVMGFELTSKQAKLVKKIEKNAYKRRHRGERDVLDSSLLKDSRLAYPDDEYSETIIEFGYLSKRTDLTDEEIEEMVENMTLHIYSPYDCTGKWFTRWISTHRNPSGLISYVHEMGLDV